jgi:hypothetical protein
MKKMKEFEVIVERTVTMVNAVFVEAETEEQARELAVDPDNYDEAGWGESYYYQVAKRSPEAEEFTVLEVNEY